MKVSSPLKGYLHTERYCLRSLILALFQTRPLGAPGVPFSRAPLSWLCLSGSASSRVLSASHTAGSLTLPPPQSFSRLFLRGSLGPLSSKWCVASQVWALVVSKAWKAEDGE